MKTFYSQSLEKTDASLLLGIVLGIKGDFPLPFNQALQATGVLHVIAASGMNVTMVSAFLFSLASRFFKRQWAIVMCIGGVIFYAFLSGLQPSILRATVMGCLAFGAQLFGRQYIAVYALCVSIFFMLFTSPQLAFDIGFQLSVMATLGIILLSPLLPKNKLFADSNTTLSAQVFTLPILLGTFGQYGLLSILVNALVLWTIPPLMILGGVGAIIGLIFEPVGKLLILLAVPFLWFFEKVVTYFGSLQWNLTLHTLSHLLIMGYYLLLVSVVFIVKLQARKIKK